jgi:hypothetical protein
LLIILIISFALGHGYGNADWKKVDEQQFWTSWLNFPGVGSNLAESHLRYLEWVGYFAKYREEVDLLIQQLGVRHEDLSCYIISAVKFDPPDTSDRFYLNFPPGLMTKRTSVAVKPFCERQIMEYPYDVAKWEDGIKRESGIRTRSLPNGFCIREYIPDGCIPDGVDAIMKRSWTAWRGNVYISEATVATHDYVAADALGYGPMRLTANSEGNILFEKGYGPIFFVFIPVPGRSPKVALLRYRFWFFPS